MAEEHSTAKRDFMPGAENASGVRSISFAEVLSGLSTAEADTIMNLSKDERYASGDYVYRAEETQKGLYLVKIGRVEEFRLTPGGQRLPISQIGLRQFFGLSTGRASYCCFAVATKESIVGFFSFEQLEQIFQAHPKVGVNLLRWYAYRLGEMEERIEELAFSHLRARVAWTLLHLAAAQKAHLVEVTHEALAEWVSGSRPRVTELLQEFQQKGAIYLSRGKIQIQEPAQLEQWAQHSV